MENKMKNLGAVHKRRPPKTTKKRSLFVRKMSALAQPSHPYPCGHNIMHWVIKNSSIRQFNVLIYLQIHNMSNAFGLHNKPLSRHLKDILFVWYRYRHNSSLLLSV